MTEGNVSPLLDFPSIPPPCLPEVPAGISEGYDTHSFVHSIILLYDDSIICRKVAMNKQTCTRKTKKYSLMELVSVFLFSGKDRQMYK